MNVWWVISRFNPEEASTCLCWKWINLKKVILQFLCPQEHPSEMWWWRRFRKLKYLPWETAQLDSLDQCTEETTHVSLLLHLVQLYMFLPCLTQVYMYMLYVYKMFTCICYVCIYHVCSSSLFWTGLLTSSSSFVDSSSDPVWRQIETRPASFCWR